MRVIDRQTVTALDLDPGVLPIGWNPVCRNGQGDGQKNNPDESHITIIIKNRAWTELLLMKALANKLLIEYQTFICDAENNGGNGVGTVHLFDPEGKLVDRIHAEDIGCEYGEYD